MERDVFQALEKGWWAYGAGGHVFSKSDAGQLLVEPRLIPIPSDFLSPMPLLMVEKSKLIGENQLRLAISVEGCNLGDYSDCEMVTVEDVEYCAWYRKRLQVLDSGELVAQLNDHEMKQAQACAIILYGDLNHAVMSEFIVYSEDGRFVGRGAVPGVICSFAHIHKWTMSLGKRE